MTEADRRGTLNLMGHFRPVAIALTAVWLSGGCSLYFDSDDEADGAPAIPDAMVVIDGQVLPDAIPVPDALKPDAGEFVCNDDSEIELNDTIGTATPTPIPAASDTYELFGLAICPSADADVFRFG